MAKNSNVIASGQVVVGVGQATGIIVNSHSSGIIKLIDSPSGAAGRVIFGGANGYTIPAGSSVINLVDSGLEYYEGLYFLLVSGTADIQVVYAIS